MSRLAAPRPFAGPAPCGCAAMGARLICLALALRMKAGEGVGTGAGLVLGRATIAALEALEPGTVLPSLVQSIARDWPRLRHDPDLLAAMGVRLERAVLDDCLPPLPFRRDIDG